MTREEKKRKGRRERESTAGGISTVAEDTGGAESARGLSTMDDGLIVAGKGIREPCPAGDMYTEDAEQTEGSISWLQATVSSTCWRGAVLLSPRHMT